MHTKRIKTIVNFILLNILRNILGVVRSKIIAVFHGVAQVGLLGQFLTLNNLQIRLVTFGVSASLINSYNYGTSKNWLKEQIFLVNFSIILIANIINTIIVGIFVTGLTILIYGNIQFKLFIWMGLFLNYIYSLSLFFEITVQAKQDFSILWKARSWSIISALITVVPLTYYFSVLGVILNLIILYTVSFIYLFIQLKKYLSWKKISLVSNIKKEIILYILKVAGTDMVRTLFILGSLFLVRIFILHYFGLVISGYYQAIVSISNYSNILAEGFIVYYYPTISSFRNEKFKEELNLNFEILLYIILPFIALIIILSQPVLMILFSSEFVFLKNNLELLLVSKLVYIIYYFYSINFLARNFLRKFLILEASRSIILIISTVILSQLFKFNGAVFAVLLTDVFSLLTVVILAKNLKFFKVTKENIKLVIYSFIIVLILFFLNLNLVLEILIFVFLFITFFNLKKYKEVIKLGIRKIEG